MLNPDFRDMLYALSAEEADFLVVGAFALAAHGVPRATGDIDIWVRPTRENAERVIRALKRFGAPTSYISAEDLSEPDIVYQIGLPPRRIDLLTAIDGVEFGPAWERRMSVRLDADLEVSVVSKEDFITNKKAAGRPKDLADIAYLTDS